MWVRIIFIKKVSPSADVEPRRGIYLIIHQKMQSEQIYFYFYLCAINNQSTQQFASCLIRRIQTNKEKETNVIRTNKKDSKSDNDMVIGNLLIKSNALENYKVSNSLHLIHVSK